MLNGSGHDFDPRSVDDLINAALTEVDDDLAWDAVGALHWRGSREVLDKVQALCNSSCPQERQLGANVLGQLGVPERTFPKESTRILHTMLKRETDPDVLQAIFVAFSHNKDPEVISIASRYASHSDPEVRHAVVLAISGYEEQKAVDLLIQMSVDPEPLVRDWATFELGTQLDLDTLAIREALADRLNDSDPITRGEAMIGLARRNDARALSAIIQGFFSAESDMALEAAAICKSTSLLPDLLGLRDHPDISAELLEEAITACTHQVG